MLNQINREHAAEDIIVWLAAHSGSTAAARQRPGGEALGGL
jgi:hypothetical protein